MYKKNIKNIYAYKCEQKKVANNCELANSLDITGIQAKTIGNKL
nr:MAG TPA: hypothetical protein [Caudoviricetes sp.]